MLSVVRLASFWRCIPVQYNCQKSSNFQGLSHFSRIFGKNDKIPGFFQAGKTVTIFPGFPGAVGTLVTSLSEKNNGYISFNKMIMIFKKYVTVTTLCFVYVDKL